MSFIGCMDFNWNSPLNSIILCSITSVFIKVEFYVQRAKNETFKFQLRTKLPFFCFLFDINRSFRSKVMVENVTSQITISYVFYCFSSCDISYVFYCFLKQRYLIFPLEKCISQKLIKILFSNFHNYFSK